MDKKTKKLIKKVWHFIWEDDSVWSWIVNVVLAFVLIKFIVYPGLGFILNTSHPVVAVVSSSMEHWSVQSQNCVEREEFKIFGKSMQRCIKYEYNICGKTYYEKKFFNLDEYWGDCGGWYESNVNIGKKEFESFPFKNGFNKGDIMVLVGRDPDSIEIGDVIVFMSNGRDPIIHRVVKKTDNDGNVYFQTKGDNNPGSIISERLDETNLNENAIIGKAILRIPLLGYIKIWFVEMLKFIGLVPQ